MTFNPDDLAEQGKQAFKKKKFAEAAELFRQAVEGFTSNDAELSAAEMKNNMSVALLQAGKPQQALDAVLGTDILFGNAKDIKRQGMAFGNRAAALEALHRYDEAVLAYERSAELFSQAGERDLLSMVKRSEAELKLKTGKVNESVLKTIGSLDAVENPSFIQRILKFFLRYIK